MAIRLEDLLSSFRRCLRAAAKAPDKARHLLTVLDADEKAGEADCG